MSTWMSDSESNINDKFHAFRIRFGLAKDMRLVKDDA